MVNYSIFQRSMGTVIRKDKWCHILQEMFRVLKPGGYIELIEQDLWHHNPGMCYIYIWIKKKNGMGLMMIKEKNNIYIDVYV